MNLFAICRLLIATRHRLATVLVWSAAFATPLHAGNVGTQCCGCCQVASAQSGHRVTHRCPACSAARDLGDHAAPDGWNCRKSCACRAVPSPLSEGPKRTAGVSSLVDEFGLWAIPVISLSPAVDPSVPCIKGRRSAEAGLTALSRCVLLQRLTI